MGDSDAQAPVAKLRYQQTKIDGAPNTILVHTEVVAIIREQQQWAQRYFAEHGAPGKTPKYLFLATKMNRNGDRPYTDRTLRQLLTELATRLDVRDSTGALVDFNRTHRFRHTVATNLLNAGVPLHVVQRYLGHLTPTMTMTYAQTLQATAEAEFLRYRKITADARDLTIDPQDLYDMLELDRRTDRILPNGWCLLPPRQVCMKGNALSHLRQVRHGRDVSARAADPAGPHQQADRGPPRGVSGPHGAGDGRGQYLARRTPPGTTRPRPHHRHPRTHPISRWHHPSRARRRCRSAHRRHHRPPGQQLMRGNPDNLRQAAARKSAAAHTRAEQCLHEMIRTGQPITFRGLAQTAGVSLDFLYRTPEIRKRVEQLRSQQQTAPPAVPERVDNDHPSSVIRTLTTQLTELRRRHRDEVNTLKHALETAQGEILELRRRLSSRPQDAQTP